MCLNVPFIALQCSQHHVPIHIQLRITILSVGKAPATLAEFHFILNLVGKDMHLRRTLAGDWLHAGISEKGVGCTNWRWTPKAAVGLLYTGGILLRSLVVYTLTGTSIRKVRLTFAINSDCEFTSLKKEEKELETSVRPCHAENGLKFHLQCRPSPFCHKPDGLLMPNTVFSGLPTLQVY